MILVTSHPEQLYSAFLLRRACDQENATSRGSHRLRTLVLSNMWETRSRKYYAELPEAERLDEVVEADGARGRLPRAEDLRPAVILDLLGCDLGGTLTNSPFSTAVASSSSGSIPCSSSQSASLPPITFPSWRIPMALS